MEKIKNALNEVQKIVDECEEFANQENFTYKMNVGLRKRMQEIKRKAQEVRKLSMALFKK